MEGREDEGIRTKGEGVGKSEAEQFKGLNRREESR